MEIVRLAESTSVDAKFFVPTSLEVYTLEYEDLDSSEVFSASAMSDARRYVTFELDSKYMTYSGNLLASVYDNLGNLKITDGIDVVKPYCDITKVQSKLGLNPAQATEAERVARKIIEAEAGSFQFYRDKKELIGMGIDYLPINTRVVKLYYMWENGELIYDYQDPDLQGYSISIDKTSIVPSENKNKIEYKVVWNDRHLSSPAFRSGSNYVIDADFGYQAIPTDIQEACEILMQDLVSDSLRYYNRNIIEFDNLEFRIKFAEGMSGGTGNNMVDNLLSKYKNRIIPGVL